MTTASDSRGAQRRRLTVAAAAATASAGLAWPALRAAPGDGPLRFAFTPVFLDDRVRLIRRWRQYLEQRLQVEVDIVHRATYAQVLDVLRSGQVAFGWICGYPYVQHRQELRLVAVPQWRGRPLYQSYLIAGAESGFADLAALRGRVFAYSDPLSNSGFLYLQHLLRSLGHEPGRYFARSFFTHSHRHVVEAVAEGLADGGAVDGYVWETLAELHPELTRRTRVLRRSPDFGFPPIVASARARPADVQAFTAALHAMPETPDGAAVLAELRLDRFVAGEPRLFDGIAAMAREQASTT